MAIRNISASIIARELLRSPHAIVATINTLVSSSTMIKKMGRQNQIDGTEVYNPITVYQQSKSKSRAGLRIQNKNPRRKRMSQYQICKTEIPLYK